MSDEAVRQAFERGGEENLGARTHAREKPGGEPLPSLLPRAPFALL